jgi:hypothetical protein
MRPVVFAAVCISTALSGAHAQHATVVGRVVGRESGEPVDYASVSVLTSGAQRLAGENGAFTLRDLLPGEVRLRFRRIGFAAKDTALVVGANDTVRVRVEMARLALELPAVVVHGACTDRTPFEDRPPVLAALFDQVIQNAERLRLLARERPFTIEMSDTRGIPGRTQMVTDTMVRGPLPAEPYKPRHILHDFLGRKNGRAVLPELPDIADTAFTNNHCLWYAGQERFGSDSVIRVDFEPVPWLARHADFEGSIFVRIDGYQLVGLVTRLNRIPKEWGRSIVGYGQRARFEELVSGVPVLAEFEVTNTFPGSSAPVVNRRSRVIGVRWLATPPTARDAVRRLPR